MANVSCEADDAVVELVDDGVGAGEKTAPLALGCHQVDGGFAQILGLVLATVVEFLHGLSVHVLEGVATGADIGAHLLDLKTADVIQRFSEIHRLMDILRW